MTGSRSQTRGLILTFVAVAVTVVGCARLPKKANRPVSYALENTDATALGRFAARRKTAHPDASGFLLLGDGLEAFMARAALARLAEQSIDAQYYLYHDDFVGRLFTYLLLEAADRGVRVRLLVDDMGLAGRDLGVAALDAHPNMEVRIFNPFSRRASRLTQYLTRLGSVTRRMHNKSFTVDNQVTVVGGRNIGNEYFDADPSLAFSDLDVMGVGPVAQKVSDVFDRYWNSELAYPASVLLDARPTPETIARLEARLRDYVSGHADSTYVKRLRGSKLSGAIRRDEVELSWGQAEVVFDRPEKLLRDFDETRYHLVPMLEPHLESLERELVIFSPYFVPGDSGTAFLTDLAARGVRVSIMTNSLASNDVAIVHAGYANYRRQLLRGGVHLYEMNERREGNARRADWHAGGSSAASLHAKSFIFDRERVFIGSLNLDPRAVLHNTEVGIVLHVPEIAERMGRWFEENADARAFRVRLHTDPLGHEVLRWHGWEEGRRVIYTDEPHAGFWRRCLFCTVRIWPIESQL